MMQVYNVPGLSVAVVKDQKVILCKGFGLSNLEKKTPFNENTVGRLASATKFLTGLVVLKMAEKGVINLNDPLKKYVNDIPKDWQSIPLWRLMNHTSGIPTTEKTPFDIDKMTEDEQKKLSERDLFELINKFPLDYKPGEKWRYQQTAFATMVMIITEKTGKSWHQVVRETILKPAAMSNTIHNELIKYPADLVPKDYKFEDGGFVNMPYFYVLAQSTGAGYNSTADDMAKMFLALNKNQIVSLKFLKDEVYVKDRMYPLNETASYSISTEIKPFGKFLTIGHSGGPDIANIRYSPDAKIGVAVLANRGTSGISEDLTNRIFKRILLGIPFDKQQQSIVYAVRKIVTKSSYEVMTGFIDKAKFNKKAYDFTNAESNFNSLGYVLLSEDRIQDAIKIFRLNVREFPKSANAYDSLGEVYMKNGNKDLAIENYEKSLELDPGNTNAVEVLKTLKAQ
jgi:CubicO group peptidase (beta-lactamase class C family)